MGNDHPVHVNASKLRIIIVEDEEELRSVLVAVLSRLGLDVRGVGDGASLDFVLVEYPADIIVLDLNLPGEDGINIAQRLRQSCSCGIVMTTGRDQLKERMAGFHSGADLYFVKPINPLELHAALLNLGKRLAPVAPSTKMHWHYDPQSSEVRTPLGISIHLSAQECIVMRLLLAVPGKTVPRSAIFAALGHPDDEYGSKRVETLLSRMRSKVRTLDPEAELPVRARHGMGYAFLADLQE